jgi:hypothetical protein
VATTDAEAFERADAVFVGRVVDVTRPAVLRSSIDPVVWTFDVRTAYKGDVDHAQEIVSEASGASCGLEVFDREQSQLVFASRSFGPGHLRLESHQYYAGLCGGTRSIEGAAPDDRLGRGRAVTPTRAEKIPRPAGDESTPSLWIGAGGVLVGAGVIGFGAVFVLRRRRAA